MKDQLLRYFHLLIPDQSPSGLAQTIDTEAATQTKSAVAMRGLVGIEEHSMKSGTITTFIAVNALKSLTADKKDKLILRQVFIALGVGAVLRKRTFGSMKNMITLMIGWMSIDV
jgi:hypothetical protein